MPRKKTLITTPYPTSEEVSRVYGIPMARVRRIEKMAERVIAERHAAEARRRETKRRQKASAKKSAPSV